MAILLILLLVFIAIVWVIYEPMSGVLGATVLTKVAAVIVAYKVLMWVLGWIMGPASCAIR